MRVVVSEGTLEQSPRQELWARGWQSYRETGGTKHEPSGPGEALEHGTQNGSLGKYLWTRSASGSWSNMGEVVLLD